MRPFCGASARPDANRAKKQAASLTGEAVCFCVCQFPITELPEAGASTAVTTNRVSAS